MDVGADIILSSKEKQRTTQTNPFHCIIRKIFTLRHITLNTDNTYFTTSSEIFHSVLDIFVFEKFD